MDCKSSTSIQVGIQIFLTSTYMYYYALDVSVTIEYCSNCGTDVRFGTSSIVKGLEFWFAKDYEPYASPRAPIVRVVSTWYEQIQYLCISFIVCMHYCSSLNYTESRIAGELEKISDLNQHVWDSVDRIFLCKKETDLSLPHHLQRKKRC